MLFSITFTGFLLLASAIDLKEFRIPNAIPLAVMALFLIKAAAMPEIAVWPGHLAAFGLTFLLGLAAFAFGAFGGGDAKLMTAVALWFGLAGLPSFLALTAMAGGVFALVLLALRHLHARHLAAAPASEPEPRSERNRVSKLLDPRAPVPYALPITFAALWLEWL